MGEGYPLEQRYSIDDWQHWDDAVYRSALDFHRRFGTYPNILAASEATLNKINLAANPKNTKLRDGAVPLPDEPSTFGWFCTNDFQIEFAIDSALGPGQVALHYDEDPWGEGDLPAPKDPLRLDSVGLLKASLARQR